MKVGIIGLGKLGLPCAVAIAMQGQNVMGYDLDPTRMSKAPQPYQEAGPDGTGDFNDYLSKSSIQFGDMQTVVDESEIIFVAVQTPHNPKYEGITRIPDERVDFDYTYLKAAIKTLASCKFEHDIPIVVISTCLPGTMRREIMPLLNEHMKLVYDPFFIAMGTTMRDFLNPEFILLGIEDEEAAKTVRGFYSETLPGVPIAQASLESAELTKVCYNTYISSKIAFANTVMEICHKTPGANVDSVTEALKLATTRLISPQYMSGGMGDGGGCHPRDNIAMSWLARGLNLSYDLFDSLMKCREEQTEWLADLIDDQMIAHRDLRVIILGYAFKPGTNLMVGSPAVLLKNLLDERGINATVIDHHIAGYPQTVSHAGIYFIGCKHPEYADMTFPRGSVILDPHRYVSKELNTGSEVIYIGCNS